jgi:photosynthetic reaction center cytochrome c subunit
VASALLAGCERPSPDTVQHGYRGTGMVQVYNPRILAAQADNNVAPEPTPAASADGPKAKDVYKNVQVLGDLSVTEFNRTMLAISNWVAPNEQCTYCHKAGEGFESDGLYTKVVARKMLQMNQAINAKWGNHVAQTGVTCYTCHRGQHIPSEVWFKAPANPQAARALGDDAGQNRPSPNVGLASLPYDALTDYLLDAKDIRVGGTTALPAGNLHTIKQTEFTYSLMIHMSSSLGVNCTYCHNTQNFGSWTGAPPQRATAWYGIRMARELNNSYLEPLQGVFPEHRLGPSGDVAKVGCSTCHQGAYKPLYGAAMAKDYPALMGRTGTVAAAASASAPMAGLLGRVLFDTGKFELTEQAKQQIAAASKALGDDPALKVDLSGFTDRTGNLAANQELAKNRAFAVRDALAASGVAVARINLRKPEMVVGGGDSTSRRVDLVAAK